MGGVGGGMSLREKLGEQVDNQPLSEDSTETPDSDWKKGCHCWKAEGRGDRDREKHREEGKEPQDDSET